MNSICYASSCKALSTKAPGAIDEHSIACATTMQVPALLATLIAVNSVYEVVLCINASCCKAISPAGTVEHLRQFHQTPLTVRKQVQAFIQSLLWAYDYSSVALPVDGLAPQPIIPIIDGF